MNAAADGEWEKVQRTQAVVSHVFAAMQDDPKKFADLQRAKVIMGLGHPITREVTAQQVERVFQSLDELPASYEKFLLVASLLLMHDGPYHSRLQKICDACPKGR